MDEQHQAARIFTVGPLAGDAADFAWGQPNANRQFEGPRHKKAADAEQYGAAVTALVESGALSLEGLITHTFELARAREAYELAFGDL